MMRNLTKPYEPNPVLRALYSRFFDKIQVDEEWVESVAELARRGPVVYVLRNLNFVDFFALDHLTKRYGLPEVRFVNDLGLGALNPIQEDNGMRRWVKRTGTKDAKRLTHALSDGGSAMLFLKRPPGALDIVGGGVSGSSGLQEGEDLIRALIELQLELDAPISLVPQVIIWTKRPDSVGSRPLDFLLGPREWPGTLRTVGQFLQNYRHVVLKAGAPFDLAEHLRTTESAGEDTNVRAVAYALFRRLERERRSITGPAQKPPDRVRHEIVRTPKIRELIAELAGERPQDQAALTSRALGMLREIQATPDMSTIRAMGMGLERVFNRIYAGIEFERGDLSRVRAAAKEGTLVLLPSHKSHIDYLVLSYLFMEEHIQLPIIAAGDNLAFFPLGPIFRRGGAFFLRRSFTGDRLYGAVMDAYVRRLVRDGYPIELFIEGGRSRSGKLLPPKFGILGMIVDAAVSRPQQPTYFVPVSIGYERVIESTEYSHEMGGGEKKKEDAKGLLGATEVLRYRYGRINLQIGSFIRAEEVCQELGLDPAKLSGSESAALTRRLGNQVMDEINRVTAVTPGALVALSALSDARRGIDHEHFIERCRKLLGLLQQLGARVTPTLATSTGRLKSQAVTEALQMFGDADMVDIHADASAAETGGRPKRKRQKALAAEGAIYTLTDKQRVPLDTTKNIIIHFFVERALVATALEMGAGASVPEPTVRDRVRLLSRIFKFEFRFRVDATFDEIFDRTLKEMMEYGDVVREGDALAPGPGRDGWTGHIWLKTYRSILYNFVEGYVVAAKGLTALLKGPLTRKDLVKRSLTIGRRDFLGGEYRRPESVSRPLIENAIRSFMDQKYLTESDGKLSLVASFRSPEAVQAIAGRMSTFLEDAD